MKEDLTDKQLLAMGRKDVKPKKPILFKDYAVKYINLGLANRDNKTMKKELPAIAKRGAKLVMDSILKATQMPKKFPKHQQPLITVMIYAGVMDELDGKKTVIYPSDGRIEEV